MPGQETKASSDLVYTYKLPPSLWEELWYTEVDTYDEGSSSKGHGVLAKAMQNADPKTREITLNEEGRAYLEYALNYMADMKSLGEVPGVRLADIKKVYDVVSAKTNKTTSQETGVTAPGRKAKTVKVEGVEVASDNFWATPKEDLQTMFDLDPDAFLAEVDNAPPKLKAKNYQKMFDLVPAFWKWYNKTFVALQKKGIENPNVIKQYKLLEADMGDPVTSTQIECK